MDLMGGKAMKKNGFLAIIAMAALSFAACNKEGLPQEGNNTDLPSDESTPVVLEPGVYPATIVAEPIMPDLAGTKAVFDNGDFAWEVGDALACFQNFEALNSAETNIATVMTTASGDGDFSGELPYTYSETDGYSMNFIYPASVVTGVSSRYAKCVGINLPDAQDGRLENLGDYFITGAYNVECEPVIENEEVIAVKTSDNVVLDKYAVVGIKVNVPESYNATRMEIVALRQSGNACGIAGTGHWNINNRQHKGQYANMSSDKVVVRHSDNTLLTGDTYACIMPFIQNKQASDVNRLQFKLVNETGTYTFSKSLQDLFDESLEDNAKGLQRGTIYNMGSFPTSRVAPKFSFDEAGAVVIRAVPAEAKIYYTTDGTEPTSESTLYEGAINVTSDTQFKAIAICEGLGDSSVSEYSVSGGVVAPVLKINGTGYLTVEPAEGHTYMYSVSSSLSALTEPSTELPKEGVDIKTTGTYYIKVSATNTQGQTTVTNGYYRVYYLAARLESGTTVAAGESNTTTYAPFTVTNTHENTDISIARGTNGDYWKVNSSTDASVYQNHLEFGIMTAYASKVSLNIYERTAKKVYQYYHGELQTCDLEGVVAPSDNKSVATTWTPIFDRTIMGESGKRVHFRVANGSEIRGFGLLEQGFESFSPAAASVSNEAPVPGQNVAY